MSVTAWFYYPFNRIAAGQLELSGVEANHILGARRMRAGDELILMNGAGSLALCELVEVQKKERRVRLTVTRVTRCQPPGGELVLASAVPKGDRLATMLDMCTQLGMTRFQPLEFERSVSHWHDKLRARCERVVIEACKQCRSAWVPKIDPVQPYPAFLSARRPAQRTLLADPQGIQATAFEAASDDSNGLTLVIGPEGGLSEAEITIARDNALRMFTLGHNILRIETAAVAALAAFNMKKDNGKT